jgi:hypothetical protein
VGRGGQPPVDGGTHDFGPDASPSFMTECC